GYARAADWVYRTAPEHPGGPLTAVAEIHRQVMSLVWEVDPPATRERAGAWRKGGVRVRGVSVSLPASIRPDMEAWSASSKRRGSDHPIVHAAAHHARFEQIHPFVDGNGRVGRLILNFMLIQSGYPPAVILASQRSRYLQTLKIADRGNPNPLAEVIARAVRGALTRFLIPNLAGDAKLIPLSALAHGGPYSAAYLRQIVLSGRLKAVREGRLYLSSKAWLNEYIATRDPRGGQPGSRPRK
ncbi:MAG: Fic family protein, partial [Actinomycetota bacterium]